MNLLLLVLPSTGGRSTSRRYPPLARTTSLCARNSASIGPIRNTTSVLPGDGGE